MEKGGQVTKKSQDEGHRTKCCFRRMDQQYMSLPLRLPAALMRMQAEVLSVESTKRGHFCVAWKSKSLTMPQRKIPVCWRRLIVLASLLSLFRRCFGQPIDRGPVNNRRPTPAPPFFLGSVMFIATSTEIPTKSPKPTQSPMSSFSPAFTPRPTTTPQPSESFFPSAVPSDGPTPFPSTSNAPSPSPSFRPSPFPTNSLQPSNRPTRTPMPSVSAQPSNEPSVVPSKPPTAAPTYSPTIAPTVSTEPSNLPSESPTHLPTISVAPSSRPSISMEPSASISPSVLPSTLPTVTNRPSHIPTQSPSQFPSSVPSSPFPSQFPSPKLLKFRREFLSMTLWGLDRNIESFERDWEAITSRHVQLYWRSFDRNLAYFFVGSVATSYVTAEPLPLTTKERRMLRGNSTWPVPDPWKITYSQDISYDYRESVTEDDLPRFFREESGLFTLPFQQNGLAYTNALAAELRNNSHIIFMDFIGITVNPKNPDPSRKDRQILIAIVSVVIATVCMAGGVIAYLTRARDPDDVFSPDSPVGAMIGINTTENILVSESYDDDYKSPLSSASKEPAKKGSPSAGSTPTGSDPPFREVQSDSSSPNVATTISDIGSTGEAGERYKVGSGADAAYLSQPTIATGVGSNLFSPATREILEEYQEEDSSVHYEEESTGELSAHLPFMADFQMEIQDLE